MSKIELLVVLGILVLFMGLVIFTSDNRPVELTLDSQHCPEWMVPAFSFQDDNIDWNEKEEWIQELFAGKDTIRFIGPVSDKFAEVAKRAAKAEKVKNLDI